MRRCVLRSVPIFFLVNDTAPTEIYTLSLHDALPISSATRIPATKPAPVSFRPCPTTSPSTSERSARSEEHTSELQSHSDLVCRLLLEKKKKAATHSTIRIQLDCRDSVCTSALMRDHQ